MAFYERLNRFQPRSIEPETAIDAVAAASQNRQFAWSGLQHGFAWRERVPAKAGPHEI
jgi:hypothetical protein